MVSSKKHSSSKDNKSFEKDKVSVGQDYGEDLVGSRVRVWWPMDRKFYKGVVDSFNSSKKKHMVLYDDGDEESLNMKKERWEFVGEEEDDAEADEISLQDGSDNEIPDATPEPEKAKSNGKSSDKGRTDESVLKKKQKTDSSAKSKSKAKSGKKSGDNGNAKKVEKTKDQAKQTSKTGNKPETERNSNFGDIGGKIVAAASRMSVRFQSKETGREIETSESMKSSKNRKPKRALSSLEEDVTEKVKKPRASSKKSKSNNTDDSNGVDDDDKDDTSDDESKPLVSLLNKTPEVMEALMKKVQRSKRKKEKEGSSRNEAEES